MAQIITFFGADSSVGTTMMAQAVAEILKEKILFVSAAGVPGTEYIKTDAESGIDDVKNNLLNSIFTSADLEDVVAKAEEFDFIKGSENPLFYRHYRPEHVELMCVAAADYDYIVIDAGASIQNPLLLGALAVANKTYLVTSQSPKAIERFSFNRKHVYAELDVKPSLIVNKYLDSSVYFSENEVSDLYGLEVVATVPFSEFGLQAEIEKNTLNKYKTFNDEIRKIVAAITGEESFDEKRGLFGRKKGR